MTLFWIDTKDEIFFNPTTPPFGKNENYPRTRRQGIEVGAAVKPFPWVRIWGNYGYLRPILRGAPFSGNDIPAVPRHKGSAGAEINLGKGFLFNTKANIVGSRHLISDFTNGAGRLDGYYTLDAKLSYSWKALKAFVGVNNVFDRKYEEFGTIVAGTRSLFPAPERNWIAGLSFTF